VTQLQQTATPAQYQFKRGLFGWGLIGVRKVRDVVFAKVENGFEGAIAYTTGVSDFHHVGWIVAKLASGWVELKSIKMQKC
jgi:hypothetical protein